MYYVVLRMVGTEQERKSHCQPLISINIVFYRRVLALCVLCCLKKGRDEEMKYCVLDCCYFLEMGNKLEVLFGLVFISA